MGAKGTTRFVVLLGLFIVVLGLRPANAQAAYATATLRGTITDSTGAVLAGATVTVTDLSTGNVGKVKTDGDGRYILPALRPGAYEITVEAPSFVKQVARGVELTVGQVLNYDVHMQVGAASETVEVSADNVPLIQTEQSQQANTISQLQIAELPNIGHDFTQQVYTLPGVANATATRSQQPAFTGHTSSGYSIGGSNGRNNLSTIDGGENEYGNGSYRVTTIPQEAIQEYQVNRNGYAAEFGFSNGSAINIVTKSGGNKLHGTAYGYFQNHSTSAQNWFNGLMGLPSAYNQSIYTGFSIGGPIKKDKIFYFLTYDYQNREAPDYSYVNLLRAPSISGPSAAQTAYVNALLSSGNPVLVGFANRINPGLTPLSSPVLNQLITASSGVQFNTYRYHNPLLRLDYQLNASNSFNLRLGLSHNDDNVGAPYGQGTQRRDFSILSNWTRTITQSLFSQLLVQVVPQNKASQPGNLNASGVLLSLPTNLNLTGYPAVFGPAAQPYWGHQQRYQFEDNLTWIRSAHTFKVGASMRMANYYVNTPLYFNPPFNFGDGAFPLIVLANGSTESGSLAVFNLAHGYPVTGPTNTNLTALQAVYFGKPSYALGGFNNPVWTGWGNYFGSYVQDSWKINSRLTLNAGMRFDVDGEPSPLHRNFYASPRLGFAWDPFGDNKTVIRAGGGIYVAPIVNLIPSYGTLLDGSGNSINLALITYPKAATLWQRVNFNNLATGAPLTDADWLAVGVDPTKPSPTTRYVVDPNYENPYTVQASFSVSRQLGNSYSVEVGYNMFHGIHLQRPTEVGYRRLTPGDPMCPSATVAPGCVDKTGGPLYLQLDPVRTKDILYESAGSSIYHAMTASLTKRFSGGLQFQVNYTFSKVLDDVVDFNSDMTWFRPSDPGNRAISVYNVPHIVVANAVYNTPFKGGHGNILKSILADISLAPVVNVHSGLPFSVRTPNTLINKVTPSGTLQSTPLDMYYATPYGTRRDDFLGATYATSDLSITKSFYLSRDRGVRVNLTAMGTNIFNRVNFDKVGDVFDSTGIGTIQTAMGPLNLASGPFTGLHGVRPTSASQIGQPLYYSHADLPRQIQLGLKVQF